MVVGVPVVHVMVRRAVVRRVRWPARGGRLRWGVVVMKLVGVAVVLGHPGVGVGGDGGVVMVLVVQCSLALCEWWSLYGVDVCGQWSLAGLPGYGAAVRWRWWALAGLVLLVCPGGLGVGWWGMARPGSRPRCRALLLGALPGPLACLGLFGLVSVGGG